MLLQFSTLCNGIASLRIKQAGNMLMSLRANTLTLSLEDKALKGAALIQHFLFLLFCYYFFPIAS